MISTLKASLLALCLVLQADATLIGIKSGLVRVSTAASGGGGSAPSQLLEDFSGTIRNNSEGDMLFGYYDGEDPGSSASVTGGSLRIVGSASTGQSIYMDFLPITASFYPFPSGYAQYYLKSGTWDTGNNRLGFMVKCNTAFSYSANGSDNVQIGSYSKNHSHPSDMEQGRHFYHLYDVAMAANVWMAYVVDSHPQHERSKPGNYAVDPTLYVNPTDGDWQSNTGPVGYMDGLSRFYFDPQESGLESSIWNFDDYYFWKVASEPDYDISSLAYHYNGTRYEVFWATEKNVSKTYDIRYRADGVSMKTAGFTSGTSGGTATSTDDDYTGARWQSSVMAEDTDGLYVAIRVQGATDFRQIYIPYHMAPGNTGFGL